MKVTMKETTKPYFVGVDASGIKRVWGETFTECQLALREYVRRRPDTGPCDKWIVDEEGA